MSGSTLRLLVRNVPRSKVTGIVLVHPICPLRYRSAIVGNVRSLSITIPKHTSAHDNGNEKKSEQGTVSAVPVVPSSPKLPLSTRVWTKVKSEASHYWSGTKLLGKEVKISSRILSRVLKGKVLTRREHRQLKRTVMDLVRVVPLLAFLLIPFMELALPIALKLFPNMLPSTFESKFAADEKKRKLLRVRLEMAKFLQTTIKDTEFKSKIGERLQGKDEIKDFMRKVRDPSTSPSHEDIVRFAQLFDDDLTLDNLSKPQLVSVCRYLNILAFGTDNFLRYQIRSRLAHIKRDDKTILEEGLENMTQQELAHACQSRGLRTSEKTPDQLREQLEQWIKLYVTENISGVLLILARAFDMDQRGDSMDKSLEAVLSSLPDSLLNEAELQNSDDSDPSTYKQKLEVLQQQEELIEDEAEQEEKEEASRKEEREEKERLRAEESLAAESRENDVINFEVVPKGGRILHTADSAAPPMAAQPTDSSIEDVRMTEEQLHELGEALSILSAKSTVLREREELKKLIEETEEMEQEEAQNERAAVIKSTASLTKKVKSMIKDIDQQLSQYDDKASNLPHIQTNYLGHVSLQDVKSALSILAHAPESAKIDAIAERLDVDKDGFVVLDDVIALAKEDGFGLGIVIDENVRDIVRKGHDLKFNADLAPNHKTSTLKSIKDDLVE